MQPGTAQQPCLQHSPRDPLLGDASVQVMPTEELFQEPVDSHEQEPLCDTDVLLGSSEKPAASTQASECKREDDFFTPPPSPHDLSRFRKTLAMHLEMLQSFLIMEYEKDMARMQEENHQLSQRLLRCDHIGSNDKPHQTADCHYDFVQFTTTDALQQTGPLLSAHDKGILPLSTTTRQLCTERGAESSSQQLMAPSADLQNAERLIPTPLQQTLNGSHVASTGRSDQHVERLPEKALNAEDGAAGDKNLSFIDEDLGKRHQKLKLEQVSEGTRLCSELQPDSIVKGTEQEDKPDQKEQEANGMEENLPKVMRTATSEQFQLTKNLYDATHSKHCVHRLGSQQQNSGFISSDENMTSLQKFVFDAKFDVASGGIIMANTLVFMAKLQYDGFDYGHAVRPTGPHGFATAEQTWPGADIAFRVLEIFFMVVFVVEFAIRLVAFRPRNAIWSGWMWFDLFIVTLGAVDTIGSGALGINTSAMRLFRLVRLVRVLKVFQSLTIFDSLFLLIKAIYASFHAMIFSFTILLVIQTVTGMLLCQLLQPSVVDEELDPSVRLDIFNYFGTFSRSMLTMFEISLGNWVVTCRVLVEGLSEWWMCFYIIYRCMFCFAILKVISAVFITETTRICQNDDELTLMKSKREALAYHGRLEKMFHAIDLDGDGFLSWHELRDLLADEAAAQHLITLGFESHDFEKLFWLIDEGEGKISIDRFLSKVGKLKGMSKTIDTLSLLKLSHRIEILLEHAFEQQGLLEKPDKIRDAEEHEVFEQIDCHRTEVV